MSVRPDSFSTQSSNAATAVSDRLKAVLHIGEHRQQNGYGGSRGGGTPSLIKLAPATGVYADLNRSVGLSVDVEDFAVTSTYTDHQVAASGTPDSGGVEIPRRLFAIATSFNDGETEMSCEQMEFTGARTSTAYLASAVGHCEVKIFQDEVFGRTLAQTSDDFRAVHTVSGDFDAGSLKQGVATFMLSDGDNNYRALFATLLYDGSVKQNGVPHGNGMFVMTQLSPSAGSKQFPFMALSPYGLVPDVVQSNVLTRIALHSADNPRGANSLKLAGIDRMYASAFYHDFVSKPKYLVVDGTFDDARLNYTKPYNIAACFESKFAEQEQSFRLANNPNRPVEVTIKTNDYEIIKGVTFQTTTLRLSSMQTVCIGKFFDGGSNAFVDLFLAPAVDNFDLDFRGASRPPGGIYMNHLPSTRGELFFVPIDSVHRELKRIEKTGLKKETELEEPAEELRGILKPSSYAQMEDSDSDDGGGGGGYSPRSPSSPPYVPTSPAYSPMSPRYEPVHGEREFEELTNFVSRANNRHDLNGVYRVNLRDLTPTPMRLVKLLLEQDQSGMHTVAQPKEGVAAHVHDAFPSFEDAFANKIIGTIGELATELSERFPEVKLSYISTRGRSAHAHPWLELEYDLRATVSDASVHRGACLLLFAIQYCKTLFRFTEFDEKLRKAILPLLPYSEKPPEVQAQLAEKAFVSLTNKIAEDEQLVYPTYPQDGMVFDVNRTNDPNDVVKSKLGEYIKRAGWPEIQHELVKRAATFQYKVNLLNFEREMMRLLSSRSRTSAAQYIIWMFVMSKDPQWDHLPFEFERTFWREDLAKRADRIVEASNREYNAQDHSVESIQDILVCSRLTYQPSNMLVGVLSTPIPPKSRRLISIFAMRTQNAAQFGGQPATHTVPTSIAVFLALLEDYKHRNDGISFESELQARSPVEPGGKRKKVGAQEGSASSGSDPYKPLKDYIRRDVLLDSKSVENFTHTQQLVEDSLLWLLVQGTAATLTSNFTVAFDDLPLADVQFLNANIDKAVGFLVGGHEDPYMGRKLFVSEFLSRTITVGPSYVDRVNRSAFADALSVFLTGPQIFRVASTALLLLCDLNLKTDGRVTVLNKLLSSYKKTARALYVRAIFKRMKSLASQADVENAALESAFRSGCFGIKAQDVPAALETDFTPEESKVLECVDVCIYAFDTYAIGEQANARDWLDGPRISYGAESDPCAAASSAGTTKTGTHLYKTLMSIFNDVRYHPLYSTMMQSFDIKRGFADEGEARMDAEVTDPSDVLNLSNDQFERMKNGYVSLGDL